MWDIQENIGASACFEGTAAAGDFSARAPRGHLWPAHPGPLGAQPGTSGCGGGARPAGWPVSGYTKHPPARPPLLFFLDFLPPLLLPLSSFLFRFRSSCLTIAAPQGFQWPPCWRPLGKGLLRAPCSPLGTPIVAISPMACQNARGPLLGPRGPPHWGSFALPQLPQPLGWAWLPQMTRGSARTNPGWEN